MGRRSHYEKIFYRDYEELEKAQERVLEKQRTQDKEIKRLQRLYELERKERDRLEREAAELRAENEALKREVARLKGIVDLDGSNSGMPTSRTPLHKKKRIPNTREKSGKNKGGQKGHGKAKLAGFSEDEVTEDAIHGYEVCPECGGELRETGKEIIKDELDYEVVVVKRRHHYPEYVCTKCGRHIRQSIPERLKEENQYGSQTQALALSLTNIGNVSMNKVRRIICGLSEGEVHPTEGYIAKLQRRAAENLAPFLAEVKKECLKRKTLYWDDTVITIAAKRGCLRFYGDEQIALYCAHTHKDKAGIDADGILPLLPKTTCVMHDHNMVNYNKEYSFTNLECVQHLLRDLQKVADNLSRLWPGKLKEHIQQAIHDRNQAVQQGAAAFEDQYIRDFFSTFNQIMIQANLEHNANPARYYYKEEAALLLRIMEYKNNYFAWITCFDLPVTNNLSERSLRGSKTHLKVSGHFLSEEYAAYYAAILSYIETCRRNGLNEMSALVRLSEGCPFSLSHILSSPGL